jgi:hypothetical protein
MIDTEAKTYTDFSTGEIMSIQEAVNRNLIQAEISEHVERKPLGLSMQNAIRLGFYVAETGMKDNLRIRINDEYKSYRLNENNLENLIPINTREV